jgi:hypothetical protein
MIAHDSFFQLKFVVRASNWILDMPQDVAPIDFSRCVPMSLDSPCKITVWSPGRRLDCNDLRYCGIVASTAFAEIVIRLAPRDAQALPVAIEGDSNQWWIINVVSQIDCIDHSRSEISYYPGTHPEFPGEPRGIFRLVVDPTLIGDHHILRPKGWEVAALVSGTLKDAIERAEITGVYFHSVT